MTAFRRTTPDVEAAQFTPTDDATIAFSDRPAWLERLLEINDVVLRSTEDGTPYLAVSAWQGHKLAEPGDWIVNDRWGHVDVVPAATFALEFDEMPTAPAATVTGGATA